MSDQRSVSFIFLKSIVVVGNIFLFACWVLFLRIFCNLSSSKACFWMLIGLFFITVFTMVSCSARPQANSRSVVQQGSFGQVILKTLAWLYGFVFTTLFLLFVIASKQHSFSRASAFAFYSVSSALSIMADENKSMGTAKPIAAGLHSTRLFREQVKLTTKYLVHAPTYNLKTTKLFNFNVSFFNFETLNFLFQEIFLKKIYFFESETNKPYIIDCGSNIGLSVLFFKFLYPEAQIMAFEPDTETFEVLKTNVDQNSLKDVTLHNKAVSRYDAPLTFYFDQKKPGHLCMSTSPERSRIVAQKRTVDGVKLSRLIEQPVDLLKMDIEGAETAVVNELAQSNKIVLIKKMIIEYHHHMSRDSKDSLSEILCVLERYGFGYQLLAYSNLPFKSETFQDLIIFAYQKKVS